MLPLQHDYHLRGAQQRYRWVPQRWRQEHVNLKATNSRDRAFVRVIALMFARLKASMVASAVAFVADAFAPSTVLPPLHLD
ncbi:hypothetical protein FCM35_KLT14361 [Carex littledalei]|uniref:Uncharacterized protein n=1 Tax=Carex littledalei TaxID=544730 RepID=A0A833QD51_9POAL|nr:hypothetical protein FCM35_KLT14361 [Carex littledalei]